MAAIVGRDDVHAPELRPVTREVRELASSVGPETRIAMQSMRDDHGVHHEQVEPFVELWRSRGGSIWLDEHDSGGHTSEYATPEFFARGIDWCIGEQPAPESERHEAWAD